MPIPPEARGSRLETSGRPGLQPLVEGDSLDVQTAEETRRDGMLGHAPDGRHVHHELPLEVTDRLVPVGFEDKTRRPMESLGFRSAA